MHQGLPARGPFALSVCCTLQKSLIDAGIPVKEKTKHVGSWRLASQSIGERSFCEERQRSHSAGHANHFRDEDMEINGSVLPGYGDMHPSKGKRPNKSEVGVLPANRLAGDPFVKSDKEATLLGMPIISGRQTWKLMDQFVLDTEICFEVSEAFSVNLNLAHFKMHSSFRRIYIYIQRERGGCDGYWLFPEGFRDGEGEKSFGFEEINLGH
ncbi:hypothetical protein CEXT_61961 [Caerostris extrusa]|uniref:Uncharacterized protein n=1 Tax=Caerostris extrusa TaxID=172846 RepID=A0AAV4R6T9_CAEEX|nr:hypothetical protein CEXT_61961 [Caerostris extrusa]